MRRYDILCENVCNFKIVAWIFIVRLRKWVGRFVFRANWMNIILYLYLYLCEMYKGANSFFFSFSLFHLMLYESFALFSLFSSFISMFFLSFLSRHIRRCQVQAFSMKECSFFFFCCFLIIFTLIAFHMTAPTDPSAHVSLFSYFFFKTAGGREMKSNGEKEREWKNERNRVEECLYNLQTQSVQR